MPRRGVANPRGLLAHLCVGFAPQRKGVGVFSSDLDRAVGGTTDEDPDALGAIRLHSGEAVLHLIIFAGIIERLIAGPFGANDVEEFACPRVPLLLVVDGVAVLPELGCIAAGDDMQRHAAPGELVDGRKLPRQQGRRGESRPLRDQDVELFGHGQYVLADLQAVGRGRMKCQQHAVEAGVLMRFGHGLDVDRIQHRPLANDRFRGIVVADVTDEFDGHCWSPSCGSHSPSAARPRPTRVASSCGV